MDAENRKTLYPLFSIIYEHLAKPPKELELTHCTDVEQYQQDNQNSQWHVICQVPLPLGSTAGGLVA
jgi:hypothetical protein